MTREDFEKKIAEGIDEHYINRNLGIMLLLLRSCEQINNDLADYLEEFNLRTYNIKREIKGIEGRIRVLADRITPTIKNTKENRLQFFEDYEDFFKMIETFRDDKH